MIDVTLCQYILSAAVVDGFLVYTFILFYFFSYTPGQYTFYVYVSGIQKNNDRRDSLSVYTECCSS